MYESCLFWLQTELKYVAKDSRYTSVRVTHWAPDHTHRHVGVTWVMFWKIFQSHYGMSSTWRVKPKRAGQRHCIANTSQLRTHVSPLYMNTYDRNEYIRLCMFISSQAMKYGSVLITKVKRAKRCAWIMCKSCCWIKLKLQWFAQNSCTELGSFGFWSCWNCLCPTIVLLVCIYWSNAGITDMNITAMNNIQKLELT